MSYTRELLLKIADPIGLVYVCDECGCPEIEGEERAWFDVNSGALCDGNECSERLAVWCPRCESSDVWYEPLDTLMESDMERWEAQQRGLTPA